MHILKQLSLQFSDEIIIDHILFIF